MLSASFALLVCQAAALNADPHASFAQVLGGVLQAAQLGVKRAERQQEKAVEHVRQAAQEFFLHEAQTMGAFVNKYAFELQQAALDLEVAMNSSRKVLDAATAADHSNAFAGPEVESRSKVIVALESAARSVRSARRQFDHLVDQAQGDAEQSLEDSADTLGRRVGDMTPVLDQAKASLQSAVEQREAATAKWHSDDKANSTSSKGDAVSRMQALAAYVKSAQAANKARTAAAKETVDASIAKADKQLAAKVKEMIADLMAAEQAEIRDLRGPLTFSVKLLRGPKKTNVQETKAKPSVKDAVKPEVKVVSQPVVKPVVTSGAKLASKPSVKPAVKPVSKA